MLEINLSDGLANLGGEKLPWENGRVSDSWNSGVGLVGLAAACQSTLEKLINILDRLIEPGME
jgi:hypothetical protein